MIWNQTPSLQLLSFSCDNFPNRIVCKSFILNTLSHYMAMDLRALQKLMTHIPATVSRAPDEKIDMFEPM